MRIIYCIPEIYSSGGKERVLINKANWFARHGHEVIIITTEQKGRNAFYRLDANVRLVDIGINYWDNLQRPFLKKIYHYHSNRIRHFSRLRDCINKYKPDVVVSLFAQEMRHLVRMRDKSKKVLEYHFAKQRILDSRRKGMLFWWDSWNYLKILRQIRKFDRFVVLTDADRNSWGGELNPIVIPNALPFDVGNSACLRNKKAIAVGRFVYEKGFDRLVDAWTNIYKMCPDWVLDVYGDGPLKPQIQAMINERGLSDVVKLHPACSNIQEKYHEASICLMTSRTEGFSMVLAEAQACGLPCIAYDVPSGPATIINNSVDGYLINDGNLVNFVNKAILLMNDSNARQTMGRKAQINALRFSEDSIMKMWTNVFDLNV